MAPRGRKPFELDTEAIREAYRSGQPLSQIAVKHGVDRQTIRARIKAMGEPLREPPPQSAKTERNEWIVQSYREGASGADIARAFGITRERVRQILLRAGHRPRLDKREQDQERNAQIVQSYHDGDTASEIAERHGITAPAVRIVLRSAGVPLNEGSQIGQRHMERNAAIVTAHEEGERRDSLAARFGLSLARVDQIIAFHGSPERLNMNVPVSRDFYERLFKQAHAEGIRASVLARRYLVKGIEANG